MSGQADDAIIKRKLLIEGESGIDDKRFAMLLKDYLHWSTSDDAVEINDNLYQTMLEKIFHCENAMEQAFLIQKMNLEQTNRYADLLDEIDKSIEQAQLDIMKERERLKEARVIRKNRQAKVVKEYPERQENLRKLDKMKEELSQLQAIDRLYDEKIDLRKKQFHLFLVALRDLQNTIENDSPLPTDSVEQKNTKAPSPMDTS